MQRATAVFRLLADPTRLRLLRVLAEDRFNVTELTGILGLAQSGVSRHLGLLKDAGLVAEDRDAGFVYYQLTRDAESDTPRRHLWTLLEAQFQAAGEDRSTREDDARLQEVLRLRKESFDARGGTRQHAPGRSWAAWARALGHLLPPLDIADIGCGEGYLALEAAAWAHRVTGIDWSDDGLERAKGLAIRRRVTNVDWKKGDLSRLPLRDATMDVALLSQSLRHATDPERALAEAARILRPGGRLLVLDLEEHDQEWVRARFGNQRLGFSAGALEGLLHAGGFAGVRVTVGTKTAGNPFTVLVASGVKPRTPALAARPSTADGAPRARAKDPRHGAR